MLRKLLQHEISLEQCEILVSAPDKGGAEDDEEIFGR